MLQTGIPVDDMQCLPSLNSSLKSCALGRAVMPDQRSGYLWASSLLIFTLPCVCSSCSIPCAGLYCSWTSVLTQQLTNSFALCPQGRLQIEFIALTALV